jgi:L-asparaginase
MPPTVAVIGTGGTIASTAAEDGARPELAPEDLLESVPAIEEYADVTATQAAQVPSFDMDFETIARAGRAVREADSDGADGIVVTHGTDTMAESAYYLDLTLDLDVPVVVTGAQRRPDEPSPDGPSNLLTAVRAASHGAFAGAGGVYVAFDETLHAARDVRKLHASSVDAFASPGTGPVATFGRDRVAVVREPGSRPRTLPTGPPEAVVRAVASGIGADGRAIEWAVADGADGIVVEATGLGNTTSAIGDAIGGAVEQGVPVVVTSRCIAGATAPVYGTPGGGETLRRRGAIHGGSLSAAKARLALTLLLEETNDRDQLREFFERP